LIVSPLKVADGCAPAPAGAESAAAAAMKISVLIVSARRSAYLKYLRSGGFWPFFVGIRKPSALIM
jgi:hypothetical protein